MKKFLSISLIFYAICLYSMSISDMLLPFYNEKVEIQKESYFFDEDELNDLRKNTKHNSKYVSYYEVYKNDKLINYVYLDTHKVKVDYQTIAIFMNRDNEIDKIELIKTEESEIYKPNRRFLDSFKNYNIDENNEIDSITSATFTTRAVKEAANRILYIHKLINN